MKIFKNKIAAHHTHFNLNFSVNQVNYMHYKSRQNILMEARDNFLDITEQQLNRVNNNSEVRPT